ncbi:O-antigen ligase family protein [Rudaeicoccus suwonensis]|nr:O-antigen ligase family protein [Rudaeicoccus suwonensis]
MTRRPVVASRWVLHERRERPRRVHQWAAYRSTIVLLDAVLGAGLLFNNYTVSGPLTGGIVLGLLVIAVGSCRRPKVRVEWGSLMVIVTVALYAFLIIESRHNDMPWTQRIAKFVILLGVAIVVAQRRVDYRSMILGACVAIVVNVPLFYAGLATNQYPPYLTGFFGDKNVAGMYYALLGLLALLALPRKWHVPWLVFSLWALYLTGSRTSIAAFLMAVAWYYLRTKVSMTFRFALIAIAFWFLIYVEDNWAQNSVYSDRAGDDQFRVAIEAATAQKVNGTPWFGLGLNQGFVLLGGVRRVFFHDSYDQAFVEGGYPFLWWSLLAFVVLGLGVASSRMDVPFRLLVAEAGIVVILITAWKLGEVFMTTGAFFVLGIAITERFGRPIADPWFGRAGRGKHAWGDLVMRR